MVVFNAHTNTLLIACLPPACHLQELIVHPFWQVSMTALSMPPEPALEAFVKAYKLAPADTNPRASMASQSAVSLGLGSTHAMGAV